VTEPTVMPHVNNNMDGSVALAAVDVAFGNVSVALSHQEARILSNKLQHALAWIDQQDMEAGA